MIPITKLKLPTIFILLISSLIFIKCEKECNCDEENINNEVTVEYPTLRIVNENGSERIIISVHLVGYEFDNLYIDVGESYDFILDKGMSGGHSDINIIVDHDDFGVYMTQSEYIKVDFTDGETTTVTLTGCYPSDGCEGIYLD
jgi:hypothetical protein